MVSRVISSLKMTMLADNVKFVKDIVIFIFILIFIFIIIIIFMFSLKMTMWADNVKFVKDILDSKYQKIDSAVHEVLFDK